MPLKSLLSATMGLSIRTKLILAIGVPLLVTYSAMSWIEYRLGKQEAVTQMKSYLTELVTRQAAELTGDLSAADTVARTLALLIATQSDLPPDQIKGLLQATLRENPDFFGMAVAFEPHAPAQGNASFAVYYCRDGHGGLRYVDIAERFSDYALLDWYRPAKLTGRPFWTEPYFDARFGEQQMCTYSAPVFRQGQFHGIVTVDVLSHDLLDDITHIKIGSGYCFLVSRRGKFMAHPDPALVAQDSIPNLAKRCGIPELLEASSDMAAGKAGIRRVRDYQTGQPQWIVYVPVPSAGWSLAAVFPERELMRPVYARLSRSLGILLAGLAVIVGIVCFESARVTRPIATLTDAAKSLARGNLDARVPDVSGRDEIALLARTFNTMVADLKSNIDARIREEAARREVLGELNAARGIQASLLPAASLCSPEQELDLHAVNAPAKAVAGDFFDYFFLDDHRLALVLGDVSGKGVPAAVYMAVARTKFRDFASPEKTPAQVVADVNHSLAKENDHGMFVSVFFGYYDVSTGELVYVNAGLNPPYVLRHSGQLETLEPTGPLVAPFPHATFATGRCRLYRDDLLLLFTDGVTEANAGTADLFGENRLEELLRAAVSHPAATLCETIIDAVNRFSQGDLKDDLTLLALKRTARTAAIIPDASTSAWTSSQDGPASNAPLALDS